MTLMFSVLFAINPLQVIIILMPIMMCYFILNHHKEIKDGSLTSRYGAFYGDLKKEHKASLLYNVIFVLRRYLVALTCVFLYDYPTAQIQLLSLSSMLFLWYLIEVRPFKDDKMNNIEIFNETTLLCSAYLLFIFTDFVQDTQV